MNVKSHLEKIARLEALRARFDPLDDFELWFWSGMTGGTHAVNAALHHAGITAADDIYAAQPGVYLVPQLDGTLQAAFRPLGDVLHVGRPVVEAPVPEDIASMMHLMEVVEQYRDPCVREGVAPTAAIVEECDKALRVCFRLLNERMDGALHEH
ncbi:hypothetical protein R69927_06280 [Paraburkholderia domus]|jgi:hypothetical protein|uniref:Uncharacterized protein n=1 Tax=Paraburkholderia domus TaxID=2793075 RepID=A0A9N8R3W7_9BURK|nr:hypothetical protein [Paraburkholderia domus]MBK5053144.1 hypothetical protein [Burkholderia sp. R-70006]MBK5065065.1 hypothetical protein [Burkholderia sp. R-70199]MBK5090239.1 hypothetical protein [Burkholderia sp. R-69927]MBK5124772.1 hypothetical protein [Burkholderia sp. R-69980]MBK5169022.1 hypothetical protein [Burkholderia sp. R-70211]MBK5184227.1 hypothetical protein [Burkholderia sp. R-69749]MCI0150582.1 hypothetical protein [Paraburkholderia sediminicola]